MRLLFCLLLTTIFFFSCEKPDKKFCYDLNISSATPGYYQFYYHDDYYFGDTGDYIELTNETGGFFNFCDENKKKQQYVWLRFEPLQSGCSSVDMNMYIDGEFYLSRSITLGCLDDVSGTPFNAQCFNYCDTVFGNLWSEYIDN